MKNPGEENAQIDALTTSKGPTMAETETPNLGEALYIFALHTSPQKAAAARAELARLKQAAEQARGAIAKEARFLIAHPRKGAARLNGRTLRPHERAEGWESEPLNGPARFLGDDYVESEGFSFEKIEGSPDDGE